MATKPDDRLKKPAPQADDPTPRVYLVVSGEKFVKPSLETYYASTPKSKSGAAVCSCHPVAGTYCSCNKVCTCNLVCTCQGYSKCSCHRYTSSRRICTCDKVCTCVPVH